MGSSFLVGLKTIIIYFEMTLYFFLSFMLYSVMPF